MAAGEDFNVEATIRGSYMQFQVEESRRITREIAGLQPPSE